MAFLPDLHPLSILKVFLWGILITTPLTTWGQQGGIFSQYFSTEDYSSVDWQTAPQNWGISQDSQGRILVANTEVVLVYNGSTWQAVLGTENLKCFKFARDLKGRVFTGGDGDLGYEKLPGAR